MVNTSDILGQKNKRLWKENTFQYRVPSPETNIAPEDWWLEDEFPFGMASWQVLC